MARIINLPRRGSRPLNASETWEAINDGRIVVHYQPMYDVQSREIIAAEALARIIDDNGNLVLPDRFIDRVERSDLIAPFGRRVIEQVCADINETPIAEVCLPRIAINLAAIQINSEHGLLTFIERTLARYRLDHSLLEFELTEKEKLAPDENGRLVLGALADRGSRIVIDDFGIGESSVAMLTDLPFNACSSKWSAKA